MPMDTLVGYLGLSATATGGVSLTGCPAFFFVITSQMARVS